MTTDATTFRIKSGSISTRRGCLRSLKTPLLKITSLSGARLLFAADANQSIDSDKPSEIPDMVSLGSRNAEHNASNRELRQITIRALVPIR
jgi:hypothetical protein